MANLSIRYRKIGVESSFSDYTDSIKNIHQYGGIDLEIPIIMMDSFVTVKIDKYPDTELCEPSTTYEWKPNQWLFQPIDGKYESCMSYFDTDGEYFDFSSDLFSSSNRALYVSPIFNVAGRYCIVVSEYATTDSLIGSKKIYVEVTDIKTSYLTTPFEGESNEFNGWNKALSKDVYGLSKNIGNSFVMCFYNGEKSFSQLIGSLCSADKESYVGYTDNIFNLIDDEIYNEDYIYGVVTEAFIDHCFIRENAHDNFVTEVRLCKLAYSGVYNISLSADDFSDSSFVYFNSDTMRISSNPNVGQLIGSYDADRQIILLNQNFGGSGRIPINGKTGDMLVYANNKWQSLHTEGKNVDDVLTLFNLTPDEEQPTLFPEWTEAKGLKSSYKEFISDDKFEIKSGCALKFKEEYNTELSHPINIEESCISNYELDEEGNVKLAEEVEESEVVKWVRIGAVLESFEKISKNAEEEYLILDSEEEQTIYLVSDDDEQQFMLING